ncbi:MAG: toll/interleukin-1 receptor domain-containing protein [Xanthomonadales bacterium]|nr:toll/interleukin-1 receptor domain-containing protein [Xanthomonadales bacterium]
MKDDYQYKAFISYSHADRKWGSWLHHVLETFHTPKHLVNEDTPSRLLPIFRDREELASSHDLSGKIQQALEGSENLIVICSPSAAKSRWVNKEVETFKKLGRSDRVFSLIVDGDPGAVNTDQDCFPPAMRQRYDADGVLQPGTTEAIAADARKQGDGRSLARLKIIAGLIGVGLDDLRQRELQRKYRRMAILTTGSMTALVITVFLAITAMMARDEATQRRNQAEDLLGFMVGDLRESLQPIGRLDLLEEVGARAMDYFATVKVKDLTDSEMSRQAQVMTQLGEIRVSQLQYSQALASFNEAYDRSEALYQNDPNDGERLFNRAQTEFWVAYVHWRDGNLRKARSWLVKYRDSSLDLTRLDPTRGDWRREVGFGHHNLAVLDFETGDLDAAANGFEQELEILSNIQNQDPEQELTIDIADAVSWLGNIALRHGDLASTLEYYRRSATDLREFRDREPDNTVRLDDWAHAEQRVVEALLLTGQLDQAIALADETIMAFDFLTDHDKDNMDWLRASTKPRIAKGFALVAVDRLEEAMVLAGQSVITLEKMIANGNTDYNVYDHLAAAYRLTAWIHQANDRIIAALEVNQKAIESMQFIKQADRLNVERTGKLASIFIERGELLAAQDDPSRAQPYWQQAHDLIKDDLGQSQAPYLLDPWIRVLTFNGQLDEATRLSGVLEAHHYKPLKPWTN